MKTIGRGPDTQSTPVHQDWAQTVRQRLNDPDFSPLGIYDDPGARARSHWPDNRITELDGGRYRYDAPGNLTEKQTTDGTRLTLAYDGAHRLVHLSREAPDGTRTEADYHYDALSRRIKKTVRHERETTTRYGWDGERVATEALDDRLRTTVYEPGGFVPLLRIEQDLSDTDPQELRDRRQLAAVGLLTPEAAGPIEDFLSTPPKQAIACYHADHLGTPLRLTDTRGRTIWQAAPDDWAAVRNEHGETDQPIRFQGQWRDEESGLYYNRYRYYDPGLGRYVSQDPIGLMGGVNLYGYVINDPVNFIDPNGLETAVIINGPTSGNPFGHTAISTTGSGVYSYGNGTELGSSLTDYLLREAPRRNTAVIIINTTLEQEQAINNYLATTSDDLPPWTSDIFPSVTDSCATRTNAALEAGGLIDPYTMGPSFPTDVTAQAEFWRQALGGNTHSIPMNSSSIPDALNGFNP